MRIIQSATPRPLNVLAVGPNGLVAAASDAFGAPIEVEVWEVGSGSRAFVYTPEGAARALDFRPDGSLLFVMLSHGLRVLNVGTWALVDRMIVSGGRPHVAFTAHGARLCCFSIRHVHGQLLSCDSLGEQLETAAVWHQQEYRLQISSAAVSRSDARVATAERIDGTGDRVRHQLSVRDANTGERVIAIPLDPASPVRQLAFTVDGAKLLVRTDSKSVQVFDAATGADLGVLKHKGRPFVTGIAVHPRGPVACARTDGTVTLWDADAREQLRVLDWKAGRLVSVAFAPDGALAAAGTEDGKVIVWDVDL